MSDETDKPYQVVLIDEYGKRCKQFQKKIYVQPDNVLDLLKLVTADAFDEKNISRYRVRRGNLIVEDPEFTKIFYGHSKDYFVQKMPQGNGAVVNIIIKDANGQIEEDVIVKGERFYVFNYISKIRPYNYKPTWTYRDYDCSIGMKKKSIHYDFNHSDLEFKKLTQDETIEHIVNPEIEKCIMLTKKSNVATKSSSSLFQLEERAEHNVFPRSSSTLLPPPVVHNDRTDAALDTQDKSSLKFSVLQSSSYPDDDKPDSDPGVSFAQTLSHTNATTRLRYPQGQFGASQQQQQQPVFPAYNGVEHASLNSTFAPTQDLGATVEPSTMAGGSINDGDDDEMARPATDCDDEQDYGSLYRLRCLLQLNLPDLAKIRTCCERLKQEHVIRARRVGTHETGDLIDCILEAQSWTDFQSKVRQHYLGAHNSEYSDGRKHYIFEHVDHADHAYDVETYLL